MIPERQTHCGQHLAIAGLGASGAAAAALARRLGAQVTLLDDGDPAKSADRAASLRSEGFSVLTGPAALECQDAFAFAVLSPGIDPSWPLAKSLSGRGIRCVSEIEFAWTAAERPVIAITGTNGKTTVTELISHLLNGSGVQTVPCGNYGTAFSEVVLRGDPVDVYTVEVSSFQLELIETFRPQVAVWMNFAPDHLDRHPSLQAYRDAKLRIFENQGPSDTAVINGEEHYPALSARPVRFSAWQDDGAWSFRDGAVCRAGQPVLALADTHLRGRHNAENLMAAMAAVEAWGISPDGLPALAASYHPAPHRCQLVGVIDGREFLNDSKATNLHATESALRGQDRPVVLIAGGKEKGLDYTPLRPLIREKTTHVFTIGEIGQKLAALWAGDATCQACGSLEEAVRGALAAAAPGQTVLFSPGTSSFDMFTGYAHRGTVFRELVQNLMPS